MEKSVGKWQGPSSSFKHNATFPTLVTPRVGLDDFSCLYLKNKGLVTSNKRFR